MERRDFIKTCCLGTLGIAVGSATLHSCGSIYYAQSTSNQGTIVIPKTEFLKIKKDKTTERKFVLVKPEQAKFPICVYKIDESNYVASLLKCTHRGCELNVGGGIYTCPCHGSEFTIEGKVLEGPANEDLKTYLTKTDNENIYIYSS